MREAHLAAHAGGHRNKAAATGHSPGSKAHADKSLVIWAVNVVALRPAVAALIRPEVPILEEESRRAALSRAHGVVSVQAEANANSGVEACQKALAVSRVLAHDLAAEAVTTLKQHGHGQTGRSARCKLAKERMEPISPACHHWPSRRGSQRKPQRPVLLGSEEHWAWTPR